MARRQTLADPENRQWKYILLLQDGGAYFGDHALIAANTLRCLNASFEVVCVEPNPEQRLLLNENAHMNHLQDFIALEDAVLWSTEGLQFDLENTDSHASVLQVDSAPYLSKTINSIVKNIGFDSLSLLMLDIEGSEESALQGSNSLLEMTEAEAPKIIFEVHRKYVDWTNGLVNTPIVQNLANYGYHMFALRDCQCNWELDLQKPELIPLEDVLLEGPPHGFNIVASKDKQFFSKEHFDFVKGVSPKYLRHRSPSLHRPLIRLS